MSEPNRNRILSGWLFEALWLLLQIIGLIFFIPLPANRKGKRGTVFLVTDTLTCPLFYYPLRSALIHSGYSVILSLNFNPLRDLKTAARRLSRTIEAEGASRCILIGHGTGALLPLALPDEGRKRVHYLLSLGGCYHGTTLFRNLSFFPALRDVVPRSNFLLAHRMNALLFDEFYPFSAWSDEWIIPDTLTRFGQGRDLVLDYPGRLNLLMYPDNLNAVVDFLNQSHPPVKAAGAREIPVQVRPTQGPTPAPQPSGAPGKKQPGKKKSLQRKR